MAKRLRVVPVPSDVPFANIKTVRELPCFDIDLDLPAYERWKPLQSVLEAMAPGVRKYIEALVGKGSLGAMALKLCGGLSFCTTYYSDLRAIAQLSGLTLGEVFISNVLTDLSARCTSMVVLGPTGRPLHGRNLDWGAGFLRPSIVRVNFLRSGRPLYQAVTTPGYVGILTGVAPGRFSVSINYRETGLLAGSLLSFMSALSRAWSSGFLVRHVLENPSKYPTYRDAVLALSKSRIIAPCYITVAGINPDEGVVLTRERMGALHPLKLGIKKIGMPYGSNCVAQFNQDWFTFERRRWGGRGLPPIAAKESPLPGGDVDTFSNSADSDSEPPIPEPEVKEADTKEGKSRRYRAKRARRSSPSVSSTPPDVGEEEEGKSPVAQSHSRHKPAAVSVAPSRGVKRDTPIMSPLPSPDTLISLATEGVATRPGEDIMKSTKRHKKLLQLLEELSGSTDFSNLPRLSHATLSRILNTAPIRNQETVFMCVMDPSSAADPIYSVGVTRDRADDFI